MFDLWTAFWAAPYQGGPQAYHRPPSNGKLENINDRHQMSFQIARQLR
jgi:hypothetical protein